ncbi:MAG: hypothetical protein GX573_02125, partial [Chloroflexi bacterium]|nr:hypothetical protein [Chloroflexota bacterium]
MPDWFQPTITLFPLVAWMFLGVGLPWALALLPRTLWRDRITVLALALALGPLGLTAVMFALGTAGSLTLAGTLLGSGLLALMGAGLAWRQRARRADDEALHIDPAPPPGRFERLLIAGIV